MKKAIVHFISLGLALLFFSFNFRSEIKEIEHVVAVVHPGKDIKEPVETILTERLTEDGNTLDFYVNVESVICAEGLCKIVPVTIYWNQFGIYQRIDLEENGYLEKYEGEEFTDADYLKLDDILKNKDSALADYDIDEIIDKKKTDDDVDAVSGATIISIDESETVVGSTLTCYTLWHWVNGELPKIIQDISIKKTSTEHLVNLLNESDAIKLIAVTELNNRKVFNKEVCYNVIENITSENTLYRKKAFTYIKQLSEPQFFNALQRIFNTKENKIRFKALYLVENYSFELSEDFVVFLSKNVVEKENKKEVNKLLDVFQNRNIHFRSVNKEILKLLASEDCSIAKRSYQFLKDKNLSKKDKKKLTTFYNKNKTILEEKAGWSFSSN